MSLDEFTRWLTWALYVLLFALVVGQAWRRPLRAAVDTVLLFGATTLVIAIQGLTVVLGDQAFPWLATLAGALIMALPYLLLRLLDDFAVVARPLVRAAEVGLALSVLALVAWPPPPLTLTLLLVAYFVALTAYVAARFVGEARHTSGVTRNRMRAVALGTGLLALTILAAGVAGVVPALAGAATVLGQWCGLASGVAYFVGFAPPTWLRRAWQEPELRAFLGRAARLPRLPDSGSVLTELEHGAASALGAPHASIGLWDEAAGVLRFAPPHAVQAAREWPDHQPLLARGPDIAEVPVGQFVAGRVFAEQRARFVEDVRREDPARAAIYEAFGVGALLVAPITAGARRLGVLAVYAPRAPIFADSDLALVQLLADQAAVILESRALVDEAARVEAREHAARLKDDFLSSAAHDLKTPLTVLLGQAQVLQRRALRDGLGPAYQEGIERMVREGRRLSALVRELLDASRVERGQLVGSREAVDLVELARQTCESPWSERHRCRIEAAGPLIGAYDPVRVRQLLDNLVDNAVKYSPAGGEIVVRVWAEEDTARLSVSDEGIGIPTDDLPHLFERYHRGANVDDRRFSGIGLGLYICRGIAEQHGGRIWATSTPGGGTTVEVALPHTAAVLAGSGERV